MSLDALKQLYNFDVPDKQNILEIRSETVVPLSSSPFKYVFRLEPTGYLDANTLLLFKLQNETKVGDAPADRLRVNCLNGALGAIQRVTFNVGDFVLNDVDGCDRWATLDGLMKTQRTQQNLYMSHYLGNQLYTEPASNDVNYVDGDDEYQSYGKGEIIVEPRKSGISVGGYKDATNANGAYDALATRVNSLEIGTDYTQNQQYAVPLGLIIPALQNRQIPLFLFDQYRLYITVYFNTADKFVNNLSYADYDPDVNVLALFADTKDVSFQDVKLQVDYIIEPAEMMEAVVSKVGEKEGYIMDFYDVVRVQSQLPAVPNQPETGATICNKQKVEFKLGQNNREIHKIYMTRQFTSKISCNTETLRSFSLLGPQRCDGVNEESINWYVNGQDVFPESELFHNGFHYDQLAMALDMDLQVERPMFMNSLDGQYAGLTSPANPLSGTYKPLGLDLRNGTGQILGGGTLIGNYPIICKYSRNAVTPQATVTGENPTIGFRGDAGAMNIDFYVMASRRAIIKSGMKGNDVMVTY
jgi:hypothetical protein